MKDRGAGARDSPSLWVSEETNHDPSHHSTHKTSRNVHRVRLPPSSSLSSIISTKYSLEERLRSSARGSKSIQITGSKHTSWVFSVVKWHCEVNAAAAISYIKKTPWGPPDFNLQCLWHASPPIPRVERKVMGIKNNS